MIANLRINGVFIPIAGINQKVDLPNGGFVLINEHIRTGTGNTASLTVNGVHVIISAEADVIISSARSDILCTTTQ